MIIYTKDKDEELVIPVGLGPNVCPETEYDLQAKTVNSSTNQFTVTPDASYNGLSSVTVNPYRAIGATVDPCINDRIYIPGFYNYDAWSQFTVNAVTAAIDSNIQPENIKKDVTILGVEGNYSGSGTATEPWYIKARKGEITDVSAYSLDEFAEIAYGNACLLASTGITTCPQLNSSTLDASNLFGTFSECNSFDASAKFDASITNIGNYAFSNTFKNSNIKDVSIYIADNLNDKSYIFQDTFANADIGDVYIKVNGIVDYDEHSNPIYGMKGASYPFNRAFDNAGASNIAGNVTIDVPNCVSSNGALANAFSECYLNSVTITTSRVSRSNLRHFMYSTFLGAYINNLSIPNLSEGNNILFEYTCRSAYIKNLNVHPYVLSVYNGFDEQSKFACNADILNVTLTADATDNIYLEYCRKLSAESVLNILSHLDLTVSGKDVYFYSNGLTVTDDAQGSIQTACNAAINAGWTINNLTINPYS